MSIIVTQLQMTQFLVTPSQHCKIFVSIEQMIIFINSVIKNDAKHSVI